ncbi:PAS domain-containing protein [Pedobacter aquatilis]|uniref:PAS domain-containing protein n=1 Tax=Pedobacter aquatilis TaxID=351343 RepID=UPI00292CFE03|nr:PAS domain-containing protein [Pedobacter aquatilis]
MAEVVEAPFSGRNEEERLAALDRYKLASSPSEHGIQDIAELACQVFDMPICLIALIGRNDVFFKANIGFGKEKSEPRSAKLIGKLLTDEVLIMVQGEHELLSFCAEDTSQIKCFAGAALIAPGGHNIGTLWLMDHEVKLFDEKKRSLLARFARIFLDRMGLWLVAAEEVTIKAHNRQLTSRHEKAKEKVSHLIEYQQAITAANTVLENVLDSYEQIFLEAPMAMGICSAGTKNLWQANQSLVKLFGNPATLLDERLDQLILDIDGQDFAALLDEVNLKRVPFHAKESKLLIREGDGQRHIFANLSLQPVGRMGDEPENIMFIIDDISTLVFLRQVTEEANKVLLNAIEDTSLGYTIVTFETGEMSPNKQFKKNYGYLPEEEFTYTDLFEAMLPAYRDTIKDEVQKAIATNSIYQAQYQVRWRDGSVHWIRAYGKPMYDANGKASHIIGLNKLID